MSMEFLYEVSADCGEKVPDTKMRLAIVKSRCIMKGYILNMTDVYLEKEVFS